MKFGGGREHLDDEPIIGYGINKWNDDEDDHPTITPFLGRYR